MHVGTQDLCKTFIESLNNDFYIPKTSEKSFVHTRPLSIEDLRMAFLYKGPQ